MNENRQLGQLGEAFVRVGKRVRVAEAQRFAPYGVTPAQGRILGILEDSERPLRMRELADILGVVPRAITPQIDALEKAGLAHRHIDPANRRSTFLHLTAEGRAMRQRLLDEKVRAAAEIFAELTTEQRTSLLELLESVASR